MDYGNRGWKLVGNFEPFMDVAGDEVPKQGDVQVLDVVATALGLDPKDHLVDEVVEAGLSNGPVEFIETTDLTSFDHLAYVEVGPQSHRSGFSAADDLLGYVPANSDVSLGGGGQCADGGQDLIVEVEGLAQQAALTRNGSIQGTDAGFESCQATVCSLSRLKLSACFLDRAVPERGASLGKEADGGSDASGLFNG